MPGYARAQRPRDQFQRVGKLLGKLAKPPAPAKHQPAPRATRPASMPIGSTMLGCKPANTGMNMPMIAITPEMPKNCAGRHRGVGLLHQQVADFPPAPAETNQGRWIRFQRMRQHTPLEQRLLGLLAAGRAGEHGQAIFDLRFLGAVQENTHRGNQCRDGNTGQNGNDVFSHKSTATRGAIVREPLNRPSPGRLVLHHDPLPEGARRQPDAGRLPDGP